MKGLDRHRKILDSRASWALFQAFLNVAIEIAGLVDGLNTWSMVVKWFYD